MAVAATKIRTVPALIETGMVIDVDIETYSLAAVTQYTRKPLTGLAFATPYQHPANGEGIYFMPEAGSLVWICFPSDGSKPFVMAWAPAREPNDSLRSNKMNLNPGDIYLGTRDENFLILRRGGVVQIGGGPICQRMFLPVNNTIRDFCENYSLQSLGGSLEWSIAREESTTDGNRPALLRIYAREYADDEQPVAFLEIGSHSDSAQNILSLVINESGQAGAAKKISLEFRKDGSASFNYESDVAWDVKGTLSIHSTGDMTLSTDNDMSIAGATVEIEAKTGAGQLKAATTLDVLAGTQVNIGPKVFIGKGTTPAMLADPTWLTWLLTHVHTSTAPGSPTSPPLAPLTSGPHISKTLFGK